MSKIIDIKDCNNNRQEVILSHELKIHLVLEWIKNKKAKGEIKINTFINIYLSE